MPRISSIELARPDAQTDVAGRRVDEHPLPISTPAELTPERPPQGTVTAGCDPGSSASEHGPRCGHVYTHPAVDPIAGVNVWW